MPDVSLNGIEFAIKGSSDEASESVDKLTKKLNGLRSSLAGVSAVSKFSAAIKSVGNAAKSASKPMSNFIASIKRIALYRAIRSIIKSVTDAIQEGTKNFYEYSKAVGAPFAAAMDKLKSSALTMKNQIGSAFGELYQIVMPIILDLISYVTQLAEVLSKLFSAFKGAEGWYKATNGADQTAEAIGGVGRAAKEALKYLAPFDELNRLPSNNAGAGGGGSANAVDYNDMFEFQAFDEESTLGKIAKIVRENLEAVQLLIDEFGFAIGVALLASGNIGLGLGMMLYFGYKGIQAVSTNWDTIKTQLQGSLGKITSVVSLSLLALGAVLAFSGASIPLGIGMMVAGAAGLATAITANWDAITESLRSPLGAAVAMISAATLVLGIFALLGGNVPLGIGLLLAGAAGLATTVAANWDNIKEIGRQFVDNIKSGIDESVSNIKEWIKTNIFDPFVTGFKIAFGIASPAKEMEEPGKMVGEGILSGIASVFTNIKNWVEENIVSPIRTWLSESDIGILSLPFSVVFEDFALPDIKSLQKAWTSIKTKTATLTAKLKGTKESVYTKIATAWKGINTKAATLTADLVKSFDENVLASIKTSWASIKSKTVSLTAKLKGTAAKTFTSISSAWGKIYTKGATLTATLVKSFTDTALNSVKDAWGEIKSKTARFTATLSASSTVQNFVNRWNSLKDKTLELKAKISETVSAAWNKAANAWNSNSILNRLATLPLLARGGVVDQATFIGNAIVGEAGKEAIVPLERNTEWVGMVASGMVNELSKRSGGGIDYASMGEAMYAAMSRALLENQDDRDIVLDGNVVYDSVLQRNRRETFRLGVNPMMAMP